MPIELRCQNSTCGKSFRVSPSQVLQRRHCSHACAYPVKLPIPCVCQNKMCGKTFFVDSPSRSKTQKYCSFTCGLKMRTTRVLCVCANPRCQTQFWRGPATLSTKRGNYCSSACVATGIPVRPLAERFWEKVQMCEHGQDCIYCCWLWQAGKNAQGYGVIRIVIDGKQVNKLAHRVSWELSNMQNIPNGLKTLHHCDVGACCNSLHLYVGTQQQNIQDMVKRGRIAKGQQYPWTKLCPEDIPYIFQRHAEGWSARRIANELEVHHASIRQVLTYKAWTHISRSLIATTVTTSA